jgi:hypothetical protein
MHFCRSAFHLFAVIACTLIIHHPLTHAQIPTPGADTPKAPLKIFYIDPVNGSMNGDGSLTRPWTTLQDVYLAKLINGEDNTSGAVHAGDMIYLLSGNHGTVALSPYRGGGKVDNTDFITIQAAPGHKPVLNRLSLQYCARWAFRGLTIEGPAAVDSRPQLIYVNNSDNIIIDKNIVRTVADATKWTADQWSALSAESAIFINLATNSTISNNNIRNIENGIYLRGDSLLCSGNTIDYFANDGITFTSSNSIVTKNKITNHYGQWNDNKHHDGMQGWTDTSETSTNNVVVDSNIVIGSTGTYPTIPIPTGTGDDYIQGISIFDGVWNNVWVTNNVIAASSYHGLSFYGGNNMVIANNTLIQQGPHVTWLGIFNSKFQVPPTNVTVRNNIANQFVITDGVVCDHNISLTPKAGWDGTNGNTVIADPKTLFVSYATQSAPFNLALKTGSPAIGAGTLPLAPAFDVLGRKRLTTRTDAGAYAYQGK